MGATDIGPEGLKLIRSFESFVPYVYDDLRPVAGGGYKEYPGGPVKGTLTVGYGHTSDAGPPLVKQGIWFTEARATDILHNDLQPIVRWLNAKNLHLTQGKFDAVCSFAFNCGMGNGNKLLAPLSKTPPDYDQVYANFAKFTRAARTGKVLAGLVRRRRAEQKLWSGSSVSYGGEEPHAKAGNEPPVPAGAAAVIAGAGTVAGATVTPKSDIDPALFVTGGGLILIGIAFWWVNRRYL